MNARERYLETLLFGKPDEVPLTPGGPRDSTRRKWETQGLADGNKWHETLWDMLGLKPESTQVHVPVGVDFKMIPQFEEKVLEHKDGHYIVQDWMGEHHRDLRRVRLHLHPQRQGLRHPQVAQVPGREPRRLRGA